MAPALALRFDHATVTFDGVPHLMFPPSRFVGLQTWVSADKCVLELTLEGGVITTEYDSIEKMAGVLVCIDRALGSRFDALQSKDPQDD